MGGGRVTFSSGICIIPLRNTRTPSPAHRMHQQKKNNISRHRAVNVMCGVFPCLVFYFDGSHVPGKKEKVRAGKSELGGKPINLGWTR